MLFRRLRNRSAGAAPDTSAIQDRIQLLRYLEARIPAKSYLEIGCNRNRVFRQIGAPQKVGVDPSRGGTHRMTSDEYFRRNELRFDLVFIDGLHHADQVLKDVVQSLAVLNENGAIVLHDCNPISEEAQVVPMARSGVPWNGDVWKAVVLLRGRLDVDLAVGDFDHGCGVLFSRPNSLPLQVDRTVETLAYTELAANRKDWLRLMTGEQLADFINLP